MLPWASLLLGPPAIYPTRCSNSPNKEHRICPPRHPAVVADQAKRGYQRYLGPIPTVLIRCQLAQRSRIVLLQQELLLA